MVHWEKNNRYFSNSKWPAECRASRSQLERKIAGLAWPSVRCSRGTHYDARFEVLSSTWDTFMCFLHFHCLDFGVGRLKCEEWLVSWSCKMGETGSAPIDIAGSRRSGWSFSIISGLLLMIGTNYERTECPETESWSPDAWSFADCNHRGSERFRWAACKWRCWRCLFSASYSQAPWPMDPPPIVPPPHPHRISCSDRSWHTGSGIAMMLRIRSWSCNAWRSVAAIPQPKLDGNSAWTSASRSFCWDPEPAVAPKLEGNRVPDSPAWTTVSTIMNAQRCRSVVPPVADPCAWNLSALGTTHSFRPYRRFCISGDREVMLSIWRSSPRYWSTTSMWR